MSSSGWLWNISTGEVRLAKDEVHVWRASLEVANTTFSTLAKVLSIDERERAGRFHFEKDRNCWIVSRGILRMLLGKYLHSDSRELVFLTDSYGKPALVAPRTQENLQFNISHSGNIALYAFAYDRQVGVDVEYMTDVDYEELARYHFSAAEYSALKALPPETRQEAFFLCWSRKEAYIKAKGKGLSIPLDQFEVSLRPGEPAALLTSREDPAAPTQWSLQALMPGTRYAGALAAEGNDWRLRCWQWQE